MPQSSQTSRSRWIPAAGLAALHCAIVATTLSAYGITRDEVLYLEDGTSYARWIVAPSLTTIDDHWGYAHPPLFKALGGLTRLFFHETLGFAGELTSYRLAILPFVFLLTASLFLFAADLFGTSIACCVVLTSILMPRLFYHAHLGALDYPLTALVFVTCYVYWRCGQRLWGVVLAALLLGFAISTKAAGGLAVVPIGFLMAVRLYRSPPGLRAAELARQLPIAVVPPAILVAVWPWLWEAPVERTLEFLRGQASHYLIPTYYFGRVYLEAPFHYPFVMAALTVPGVALVAMALGVARPGSGERRDAVAYVAIAALVELAVVALPGVRKAGGTRIFLPAFPFLCLLAGAGLSALCAWSQRPSRRRAALGVYSAALVLSTLPRMIALHPFEIVYFNELIGGTRGAAARGFDLDYWGGAYWAALPWMNQHADSVYWVPVGPRLMEFYQRSGELSSRVRFGTARNSDYVVALARPSTWPAELRRLARSRRPVYAAGPAGLELVRIYEAAKR